MKLHFYGADRCVTGSCHCLEINGKKILVDCGLQQGRDELDNRYLAFAPGNIDILLVTHAHIDHTGRIPLLVKNGFHGRILTTRLTADLMKIMLLDSAHIQESDAEYENRKGERAGRIRHHLKHNLWRKECTILFVGYQAVNTLGRSLLEGADNVKLFGESIEVQAEICQLTGLSGHADREGLLKWVNSFEPKPKRVFIIHGEDEVENVFAQTLTEQGFNASAPYNGEQWAIGAEGAVCLKEGTRIRIEHHISEGAARAATVFQRLLNAGKRLLRVIEHNEGGANKDLAKFADQINALCDKWDR